MFHLELVAFPADDTRSCRADHWPIWEPDLTLWSTYIGAAVFFEILATIKQQTVERRRSWYRLSRGERIFTAAGHGEEGIPYIERAHFFFFFIYQTTASTTTSNVLPVVQHLGDNASSKLSVLNRPHSAQAFCCTFFPYRARPPHPPLLGLQQWMTYIYIYFESIYATTVSPTLASHPSRIVLFLLSRAHGRETGLHRELTFYCDNVFVCLHATFERGRGCWCYRNLDPSLWISWSASSPKPSLSNIK